MWLFSALESSGLRSSKLQSSAEDTDMTAPQLSNSPQYCFVLAVVAVGALQVTYVWCAENSDQNSVVEKFVTILDNHVCSADEVEIMHC